MGRQKGEGSWKKGQSGNPKGRPKKGETLSEILRELAKKKDIAITGPDGQKKLLTRKQALAERLWALGLGGDTVAIKYIYDRVDGTPQQSIAHSGEMTYTVIPAQPPDEEQPDGNDRC